VLQHVGLSGPKGLGHLIVKIRLTYNLLTIVKRSIVSCSVLIYNRPYMLFIGESMIMASTTTNEMRQSADWMVPSDDRILELIREHGNLTPSAIEAFGGPVRQHASIRAKKLAEYGLLKKVYRGLYGITDKGIAYLDEEFDASELEPVND